MCILLKFHCAKFGVSNLFVSKVIEEKPLGGRLDPPPPLVKEELRSFSIVFRTWFSTIRLLDFSQSCSEIKLIMSQACSVL